MYKILFPEAKSVFIQEAAATLMREQICVPVLETQDLKSAFKKLSHRAVDAIIAGIDFSSRDVILAARDQLGLQDSQTTFSSIFVCKFADGRELILTDGACTKNPTAARLADIAILANDAAQKIFNDTPRLAFLSFSTHGSGGNDPSISKISESLALVRARRPDVFVDGEMQLDAAISPRIGAKKYPDSSVAGRANVLIAPDLNSGNILYKSLEQFAGATIAGPILLGFKQPISDLSRGSTVDDILYTAKCLIKLI